MMAQSKPVEGKKVVFGFAGAVAVLAMIGLAVVIWTRAQPVVQTDQRNMARLLSNAYQKFRYDMQSWPEDSYDAAVNFRTENPDLADKVKKAQTEWGLSSEVIAGGSDSPSVKFTFTKPSPLELTFALYNRDRKRR